MTTAALSRAAGPSISLLGGFSVHVGHQVVPMPRNAQRVLGFLAVTGVEQLRDTVAGNLWPGAAPERDATTKPEASTTRMTTVQGSSSCLHNDRAHPRPLTALDGRPSGAARGYAMRLCRAFGRRVTRANLANVRSASLTARLSGNSSAMSGSRSTTLEPCA